jgi:hypothetical protein
MLSQKSGETDACSDKFGIEILQKLAAFLQALPFARYFVVCGIKISTPLNSQARRGMPC